MTQVSAPIIEKATALYRKDEDMIDVSILWSNRTHSTDLSYVKIDLKAGNYECTLIDHDNIIDSGDTLYHKSQKIHGLPSKEIELRTYNILGLQQELKVPVISIMKI